MPEMMSDQIPISAALWGIGRLYFDRNFQASKRNSMILFTRANNGASLEDQRGKLTSSGSRARPTERPWRTAWWIRIESLRRENEASFTRTIQSNPIRDIHRSMWWNWNRTVHCRVPIAWRRCDGHVWKMLVPLFDAWHRRIPGHCWSTVCQS